MSKLWQEFPTIPLILNNYWSQENLVNLVYYFIWQIGKQKKIQIAMVNCIAT